METTITIPTAETEEFTKRLSDAQSVANNLGAAFEWKFDKPYTVKLSELLGEAYAYSDAMVEVLDVTVTYEPIKLQGWTLVGVLDHTLNSEYNLVSKAGKNIEVPQQYRSSDAACVHCNTRRNRNKTILVHNEESGFKQVGTSCVKDYLGHDIYTLLKWFSFVDELDGEGAPDEFDRMFGASRYDIIVKQEAFLKLVAGSIKLHGWTPRSKADGIMDIATADRAWQCATPVTTEQQQARQKLLKACDDKTVETVKAAIAYVDTFGDRVADLNDYEHNLYVAFQADTVTPKTAGLVASGIAAYYRHIQATMDAKDKPVSKHVGEIKQRLTLKLKHVITFTWATQYGPAYLNKFVDEHGNIFVWKASSEDFSNEQGEWFAGKGTIVKHDMFNGEAQTKINRCKLEKVQ